MRWRTTRAGGRRDGYAGGTLLGYAIVVSLVVLMMACGGESGSQGIGVEPEVSEGGDVAGASLSGMARAGEAVFNANCSLCHGVGATGTNQGPPLVDRIYEPGHHPDFSIRNAVAQGVRQHHWVFGDMAPVPGVSDDDVESVVCYIREIQRAGGIFEGDGFQTVC